MKDVQTLDNYPSNGIKYVLGFLIIITFKEIKLNTVGILR